MASIPMRHPDDRSGERSGRVPISRSTLERINREYLKREEQVKSHEGQSYKIIDKIWNGIKGGGWRPKPPTVPGGKPPRGSKGTGGKGQGEKGTGGKGEGEKNPSGDAPPPATGGGGGGGDPPEDPSRGGSDRAPPAPGGGGDPPEDPTRGRSSSATPGNKSDGIRNEGTPSQLASIRGHRASSYRIPTRAQISKLKKELNDSANVLKQGCKLFNEASEEMRLHQQKIKSLVDDFANMLKAGIDTEAACMNISREQAAELKILVDELKEALKNSKTGGRFNVSKFQEYTKTPRACLELGKNLTFYALYLSGVLVLLGYLKLDEPSPFNPRETMAGKMLHDDFCFGLKVCCKSTVSASDTIISMLSGDLNALQSKLMLKHIEKNWSGSLDISPGNDMVLKGGLQDMWVNGFKADVNLPLYGAAERKLELKWKHPFGSLKGTLGLNATPIISLNAMFGNKQLSAGALFDVDPVHRILSVALGGVINLFGVSASCMMAKVFHQNQAAGQQPPQQIEVNHNFSASLHYKLSESTSAGGQLVHNEQEQQTTVTVGVEHHFHETTFMKAKISDAGVVTGLLQHKFGEKSSVSLCSSVNLRALNAVPRFGVSICIAP